KVLKKNNKFLPSANVVFDLLKDKSGTLTAIKATGGGFGHGVGMSQLGASFLSRQGKSFVDILQHYYKGVAIGTIPLTASSDQGMSTRFYVDKPTGMLNIEAKTPCEVRLALNDKPIVLPIPAGKTTRRIDTYLTAQTLNDLKIFPAQYTNEPVK